MWSHINKLFLIKMADSTDKALRKESRYFEIACK